MTFDIIGDIHGHCHRLTGLLDAGAPGPLVAYRWDEETDLASDKLNWTR